MVTKKATTTNQVMSTQKSPKKKINHVRGRKRFRHVAPNPVSGKHHEESASSSSKQSSVEDVTNPRNKNVSHPRGRNRRPVPKPAGGNPHEKKRKEKLVSASQNRQPVPEQVVTREDVTKEIMANYQVESKIGWKQRVEEWLGSQPNITPPCNSNDKENGNERQEAEEATSRSIQEKKQLKKQKLSKSRKEFQSYKKSKTPTSSGVQGKRKFTSISRG